MDTRTRDDLLRRASIKKVPPNVLKALVAIVVIVVIFSLIKWSPIANGSEFEISHSSEASSSDGDDTQESGQQNQYVVVHVSGAVVAPGVYSLPAGNRVNDAVQAAGGFSQDASTSCINLARQVQDGEQIIISTQEQAEQSQSSAAGTATSVDASLGSTSKININTADATKLQELQGIGPSTAQAIIDYRTQNGNFKTIEDIKEVSGIGDGKYSKIEASICV